MGNKKIPILWHLSSKYHERRLLACSLLLYTLLYSTSLILAYIIPSTITITVFLFDLSLSLSRLFIFSSSSTFVIKHLTHDLPASSLLFNAPISLGISEALSNLLTTTSTYSVNTRLLFLGMLVSMTVLVFIYYG